MLFSRSKIKICCPIVFISYFGSVYLQEFLLDVELVAGISFLAIFLCRNFFWGGGGCVTPLPVISDGPLLTTLSCLLNFNWLQSAQKLLSLCHRYPETTLSKKPQNRKPKECISVGGSHGKSPLAHLKTSLLNLACSIPQRVFVRGKSLVIKLFKNNVHITIPQLIYCKLYNVKTSPTPHPQPRNSKAAEWGAGSFDGW